MAVAHLFPVKPPRFDVGQQLVAPAGSPVTFTVADWLANLTNNSTSGYSINWDFGDGAIDQVGVTVTTPSVSHTYTVPGIYTVCAQTLIGESVQTAQWQVRVVPTRAMIATAVTEPFVAAIHDTFSDDVTGRSQHAVVLLPALTGVQTGTAPGAWGAPDTLTINDALLAQATDDMATRLQAAYCSGFGRMAMPAGRLEQAVHAEFALESISVGTGDAVATTMTTLENAWRELMRGAGDGHRGVSLAASTVDVVSNVNAYAALVSLPWAPQTQLGAGTGSVRTADVMRWLEYTNREVDDRSLQTDLVLARWRRFAAMYAQEVPRFDASTAWAWEVAQAAMQAVYSFYVALDSGGATPGANTAAANVLVLGDPVERTVTVRLVDTASKLWAIWQVGPAESEQDGPALADLGRGQAQRPRGGSFVGVRGVAMATTIGTAAPMPWDIRRVESLFSPELRAATPGFGVTFASDNVTNFAGQASSVLQTTTTASVQDGTQRRYATVASANTVVADVQKPAIPLASFDRMRGGLRPHAAWAVAQGGGGPAAGMATPRLVEPALAALRRGGFDAGVNDRLGGLLGEMGLSSGKGFDWEAAMRVLRHGGR